VGIKSAVGRLDFWMQLAYEMENGRGPDFITIDGGEGGTGAAPTSFADNVSLPFEVAFTSVYSIFQKAGLHNKIVFIGSAKLGLPSNAVKAFRSFYEDTFKGTMKSVIQEYKEKKEQEKVEAEKNNKNKKLDIKLDNNYWL